MTIAQIVMGFLLVIMFMLVGFMIGFLGGGVIGCILECVSGKKSVADVCGFIGGFFGSAAFGILGAMAIMGM